METKLIDKKYYWLRMHDGTLAIGQYYENTLAIGRYYEDDDKDLFQWIMLCGSNYCYGIGEFEIVAAVSDIE